MKEKRIFKRALITGISGSGGSYLAEHIVNSQKDVEVHGIARWHSTTTSNNLDTIRNNVKIHECDLNDFSSILNVLKVVKPDVIFHLASHANVRAGFITPLSVIQNNVMGTSNLYEAIRASDLDPIIQHCSTSEVYGQVDPKDIPIKENCPLRPTSPYAVSKTTQDHLSFAYWKSYNMKIIRTRMFAYFNPRRADLFATSFARQVALIEAGKQKELLHGNLDSVRTMIDVRDAMNSYWQAALYCEPGEAYNIGGPKVITVGEFLNILKKMANKEIPTRINPDLLRPSDVTLQIPDISKFVDATNWEAKYTFEESISHLLNYWRERVN
jgi:GDP-4-dehydro-6-deoxy-D-mannose reductase